MPLNDYEALIRNRSTQGQFDSFHQAQLKACLIGQHPDLHKLAHCGHNGWACGVTWFCQVCSRNKARKLNKGSYEFQGVISTRELFTIVEDVQGWWRKAGTLLGKARSRKLWSGLAIRDIALVKTDAGIMYRPHFHLLFNFGTDLDAARAIWPDNQGYDVKLGRLTDQAKWLLYSLKPIKHLSAFSKETDPKEWVKTIGDLKLIVSARPRFRRYGTRQE